MTTTTLLRFSGAERVSSALRGIWRRKREDDQDSFWRDDDPMQIVVNYKSVLMILRSTLFLASWFDHSRLLICSAGSSYCGVGEFGIPFV